MFLEWDMVLYEKGKKIKLKLLRVIGKKIVLLCLKEKSNILFCKCGHICICKKCKEKYKPKSCPICKKIWCNIKRSIIYIF